MAKVVNLNRARKAKARDARRTAADANAALHGRSKAERDLEAAQAEKARRDLDGKKTE